MGEIWRPVVEWESLYEVSSVGRVRRSGKVLAGWIGPQGYPMVNLNDSHNGRRKVVTIHRLVCAAFLSKGDGRDWVNHKNSDRTDNRLENLEWVTPQENVDHMVAAGRYVNGFLGKRKPKARLSDDDVRAVRSMSLAGVAGAEIARRYGMDPSHMRKVISGKFYQYVKDERTAP